MPANSIEPHISIVLSTCATVERNAESKNLDRWKSGASERIHPPFFFRSRLVSSGVYYHLSDSILLCLHRPAWRLIAPGVTGEEKSNCFLQLSDRLLCRKCRCKMTCFTYECLVSGRDTKALAAFEKDFFDCQSSVCLESSQSP